MHPDQPETFRIASMASAQHRRGKRTPVDNWINPPAPDVEPEPGYHEWLAREIEKAIREADEVRKEFGLD